MNSLRRAIAADQAMPDVRNDVANENSVTPVTPPVQRAPGKLQGNAAWLSVLTELDEPVLPADPLRGPTTAGPSDTDRDENDHDGGSHSNGMSGDANGESDADDENGSDESDRLDDDRDDNGGESGEQTPEVHDPNPLSRGIRIFVKLIAEGRNPVSCMRPLRAQVGPLLFIDRLIVRPKPGPSGSTRGSFGWSRDALLRDGVRTVGPSEIRAVLDGIRHGDYQPESPDGASGPLVIDPRIGLTFFRTMPESVVRLDSGGKRVTVDVAPVARYRDPDDELVVVDRDAREHKIIDAGEFAMRVPYPQRSREATMNREIERLVRDSHGSGDAQLRIPRHALPKFIAAAGKAGIAVEMAKAPARLGGSWSVQVKSGADWFELTGELVTPEGTIPLRELVDAAKRQPDAIEVLTLADGTSVVVPARLRAVLKRLSALLASRDKSEGLRFGRAEALLLDEALEGAEVRSEDDAFVDLRTRLQKFDRAIPCEPTSSFKGTLRDYQKAGLGWFEALRGLEFGGCLADEMGLGKTIQVLAMLLQRKQELAESKSKQCSIIVLPRSLVRNWLDEASRFAPSLRVIDLSHGKRTLDAKTFASCDVALMTYGTVLRDAETLSKRTFDYVILDEAQAIKNADARTSRACKKLQAEHRLALTGTPIENHLGELWSLMEFLNPGATSRFEGLAGRGDPDDLGMVRRAVQPFILAAHEEGSREGAPRAHRADAPLRDDRRAGEALQPAPREDPRRPFRSGRADRHRQGSHGDPRGAAAASADLLPPGPRRSQSLRRRLRQDGSAPPDARGVARGEAEDARLLAVHELPRPGASRARRTQDPVRISRRRHRRSRRARQALRRRRGRLGLPPQPQGRRRRPQPPGGRTRRLARSVVESRGRGSGDRPCSPHRPAPHGARPAIR
jgi:hypothetical protein